MGITNNNPVEENLKLSIQVSLNGLSFCALQQEERKILFFRDIFFGKKLTPIETLTQIEKAFEQEPFLQRKPQEVEILYSNELYSLVPRKVFIEENASDYLKFNAKILQTDFIAQDYLNEDLVNVYIPYTNINNWFFDTYGEFQYRHCVSVLAEELLQLDKNQEKGPVFYLNSYSSGYDLVGIENGKLIFANSFLCDTKEDFLYYLLFTAEQLDIDQESFDLVLLGKISPESESYKLASSYIRNIGFMEHSFGFIFEARDTPPKGYEFFTLLKSLQ